MEVNGFIYAIIDGTNDFEYIGQTTKTVEERFNEHTKADSYIGHVIRARGKDLFVVAVLKVCTGKDELDYWERRLIKSRNTKAPNGYNLTDGGDRISGCTEETRKKIAEANKGKHPTPEHREHISEAKKGHITTDETRDRMSESQLRQTA